ncbi:hypothetical protein [Labrenzia sp. PHM005]|uniref:hypothetical protein n=1 Tax=Labrenzia sp. PHM005 TaxID=2590016 RepID=UPI0011401A3C|nr:hypothetical protein [Labrenzia sp. PHM005]QDG77193.1 hypothetical protein FJ695_15665 [Labrenzia sp. PHM005]
MFAQKSRISLGLSTAIGLFLAQAGPVLAFDATGVPVADAFLKLLDSEEGDVESYGAVAENGGVITISDLVLKSDGDDDEKVTVATATLSDGMVLDNGRLKLGGLQLDNLELVADDGGMTMATMSATDVVLPAPEEIKDGTPNVDPSYKTVEASTIQINDENGKIANIDKITSTIDSMDGDQPTSGRFAVTGIVIDVKQIQADEAKTLQELGYETLSMNVSGSGKWDPDAATINIPDLKIDGQNAAALSLSVSLGGVTREVIEKLNTSSDNPDESMALMQNISVSNVKIRLDDASLTGRILDQEAKKAGIETPQYVAGLTGSLPLMLGMLQNKELEGQVAAAITQYLNDPGSLEISASPDSPVPFAQVMGAAMMAPQMIPQLLGVSIQANQ